MPPFLSKIIAHSSIFNPGIPSGEFSEQWKHPGDVFSVLLILGGDVVGRALAQFAGGWLRPPSFSFGEFSASTTYSLGVRSDICQANKGIYLRMGCLLDQRPRLRCGRKQAHASTRLRMHCYKWKEWILQVQFELDTGEDGQRL